MSFHAFNDGRAPPSGQNYHFQPTIGHANIRHSEGPRPRAQINSAAPNNFPFQQSLENNNIHPPFFNQGTTRPHFFNQGTIPIPSCDFPSQQNRHNFQNNAPPSFNYRIPPPHRPAFQCHRPPYYPNNAPIVHGSSSPANNIQSVRGSGFNLTNTQIPPPSFNNNLGLMPGIANPHTVYISSANESTSNVMNEFCKTDESIQEPKQLGHQLLEKWLQEKRKIKKFPASTPKLNSENQLWTWMNQLRDLMHSLTSMSTQVQDMKESYASLDNSNWEKNVTQFENFKKEYINLKSILDEVKVDQHEKTLIRIQKKRNRLAKQKINNLEYKMKLSQQWDERNKEINQWQEKIQAQIREENLRKSRKAAADCLLSKVTREIQDATRLIETMLALKKLRLIRRDAAQKRGDSELGESRQSFEEKISDMTRLVQGQLECYKEEEAKLKQVIQSEQDERTEKERLLQVSNKKQKEKEDDEELQKILFGEQGKVSIAEPLFHFFKYYSQAEENLQSFIQIRQEWDSFLVPDNTPGSSAVPMFWVIPDAPSSATWAQALK